MGVNERTTAPAVPLTPRKTSVALPRGSSTRRNSAKRSPPSTSRTTSRSVPGTSSKAACGCASWCHPGPCTEPGSAARRRTDRATGHDGPSQGKARSMATGANSRVSSRTPAIEGRPLAAGSAGLAATLNPCSHSPRGVPSRKATRSEEVNTTGWAGCWRAASLNECPATVAQDNSRACTPACERVATHRHATTAQARRSGPVDARNMMSLRC